MACGWSVRTAVFIIFMLVLAACPAPEAPLAPEEAVPAPEVVEEQEPVVILQGVEPATLDRYFSTQQVESSIQQGIFDHLTSRDPLTMQPVPQLATEWYMVDDLTWEYKLREGVVATNGEVLDAHAVAYSFERGVDPEVGARGGVPWVLGTMRFDRVEVIDDYTVRIHTHEPIAVLPMLLVNWSVLPPEYYSSTPLEELARNPIGSGPYKLVEWVRGDRIVVEANEDYWGGAPEVKRVIWRTVPEASARIAELNTGAADLIVNLPPDLGAEIDPAYGRLVPFQGGRRIYIGFVFYGPNNDIIQDARVRQALNYGFDFQRIIDHLLDGNGERTGTFVNPPNQAPAAQPFPYDPERARALLAEAGLEDRNGDGFLDRPDGEPLVLTMQTPSGRYVKDLELALPIAADLADIGIKVEVEVTEHTIYATQVATSQLTGDLFLQGAGSSFYCQGDLADFYTHAWEPGMWRSAEFDAMFEELVVTLDPERRQELCYRMQEFMQEDPPLLFLYFQMDYYGLSNRIDWTPNAREDILAQAIRFAE